MTFFVTCGRGVEPYLAAELDSFGLVPELREGGVSFDGSLTDGYRVCLWSRLASRVLLFVTQFPVDNDDSLYAGTRAVDWTEHLAADGSLAVRVTGRHAAFNNTHFAELRVKDAVVDMFRDRTGVRPRVEKDRPDLRITAHLTADTAQLYVDLSRTSLHQRGYRSEGGEAPLRETLAAALLFVAGWPQATKNDTPLIDPMCGSGTILLEAAGMALDIAPGLLAARTLLNRWLGHDRPAWDALLRIAEDRKRVGDRPLRIWGSDRAPEAIERMRRNIRAAGLENKIQFARAELDALVPPTEQPGLVVTNPPYGERLGHVSELGPLYQKFGDLLRQRFLGWTAHVLTEHGPLSRAMGLRVARRTPLYNGPIECRVLEIPISAQAVVHPLSREHRLTKTADGFKNRLEKNLKSWATWARRNQIDCYRIYDADLPEYALSVDRYGDNYLLQEFERPSSISANDAEARLQDAVVLTKKILNLDDDHFFLKTRRRQSPTEQYERTEMSNDFREIEEGGHKFWVNLRDYLDTGIYLDQRRIRQWIALLAHGRNVLNLYSYTGTASVYAARAGAKSVKSVDWSNTYNDWNRQNFELNRLKAIHHVIRADCIEWLRQDTGRYGLVFVAPPTFSNSKRSETTFDVIRDHVVLLSAACDRLRPDGTVIFVTHAQRFKWNFVPPLGFTVEEMTDRTVPKDFGRRKFHRSWAIRGPDAVDGDIRWSEQGPEFRSPLKR